MRNGLNTIGGIAICLAVTLAGAQDRSQYPTHRSSSKSGIDWVSFYDRADEQTAHTRQFLAHELDIAYGDAPKQKLDVYQSSSESPGPVFVFIHGGGFVEGDRAHYGFVAKPLAASGIVTVVMSYRLTPARYPAQVEDARLALAWVYRNIAKYGGDPTRIFIGGHSAGAILSAYVSVDGGWLEDRELPAGLIKGYVAVSGPYDLRKPGGFVDNYLPDDSQRNEASPLLNIRDLSAEAIVAVGSLEEAYVESSREFVQALQTAGGTAKLIELEAHHHAATALALGDEGSPVTAAMLELMLAKRP